MSFSALRDTIVSIGVNLEACVSGDAVKARLKEVVDNEDKSAPMNDDELAVALKSQGVDIARRTVAKYRKLLEIPPARKRKTF